MTDADAGPEADGEGEGAETDQTGTTDFLARATGVGSSIRQALTVPALALLSALIIGAFIIALTDVDSLKLWGDDPGEAFRSTMSGIGDAYRALFEGSLGSPCAHRDAVCGDTADPRWARSRRRVPGRPVQHRCQRPDAHRRHGRPLGRVLIRAPSDHPHPACDSRRDIGGAIWGGLAGLLKARTGAHEVITTIMLNFIALFLVDYLLKTSLFQAPGRNDPISKPANDRARSRRSSTDYRVHIGFLVALVAVVVRLVADVPIDDRLSSSAPLVRTPRAAATPG